MNWTYELEVSRWYEVGHGEGGEVVAAALLHLGLDQFQGPGAEQFVISTQLQGFWLCKFGF